MKTPFELLRSYGAILGYQSVGLVIVVVTVLLAALVVPPHVFGDYYILLSIIQVIFGIAVSWIPQAALLLSREEVQRGGDSHEVLASSLVLQAALIGPILMAGWLARPLVPQILEISVSTFVLMAITITLMAAFETLSRGLQASHRFEGIGLSAAVTKIGPLLAVMAIWAGGPALPELLLLGIAGGFAAALAVTHGALPSRYVRTLVPTLSMIRRIGSYGVWLPFAGAAVVFSTWMQIWFVRAYSGPVEAGVYAWAASLHALVNATLLPLSTVMAPNLIDLALRNDREGSLRRLDQFIALMVFTAALMPIIFGAVRILLLMLPVHYRGAGPVLVLLLSSMPAQLLIFLLGPLRHAYPKMIRPFVAISVLVAFLTIGLNLVMTPRFGVTGAALALSLSIWCSAFAIYRQFLRGLDPGGLRSPNVLLFCAFVSVPTAVGVSFLSPIVVLPLAILLSIVFLLASRSMGVLRPLSDLSQHLSFLPANLRWIASGLLDWCGTAPNR